MAEFWDVYNENRQKTGRLHQRGLPMAPEDYHLTVMVWLFDSQGRVLLTRRHPDKPWGDWWECTGGAVTAGEDSYTGALREVAEEIGVDLKEGPAGKLVKSYRRTANQPGKYSSFYDVYLFVRDIPAEKLILQPEEVTDAKWVTRQEYEAMLAGGRIVPTLDNAYELWDSFCEMSKNYEL